MENPTREQANQIIKENMRGELAEEVFGLIQASIDEKWESEYDYLDALEHYDGSDFYQGAFKRELTRLLKLIGIIQKVKPGQTVTVFSTRTGRSRTIKPGQWYCKRAYGEFK